MIKTLMVAGSLGLVFLAGCNQCEKLTESICADLGAEECNVWKAVDGPAKIVPGGRKPNKACAMIRSNDKAYAGLVLAARGTVLGEQMQRAVRANDKELQQAISAKLAKHAQAAKAMVGQ